MKNKMSTQTIICVLCLPISCLLFSCRRPNPILEQYSDFLHVENMLEYCLTDGVYNGEGKFYLDGNTHFDEVVVDDGRLCSALLSLKLVETAADTQNSSMDNLTRLINYHVPFDDYAYVVVYEGDILGCEIYPDLSIPYCRYFDLERGKALELYTLAVDVRDDANQE